MRLIDADKFKMYVIDGFEQNKDLFDNEHRGFAKAITQGFLADIDEQPTAYDIDKVIERLETTFDKWGLDDDKKSIMREIVKKGGAE